MSLKSFLAGIIEHIAELFKEAEPIVKKALNVAYHVTNDIKIFDTALPQFADVLSHLLPSHLGEEVINILRVKLPEIVIKLRLVDVTLGLTDPNQIMQAALKVLESMDGETKNIFLNSLSIMIARETAGSHLPWDVAAYTGKWYFDHNGSLSDAAATAPVPEATAPVSE